MKKIKEKWKIILFIIVLILSLLIVILYFNSKKVELKNYQNDYYKIKYDTTWNLKNDKLEHKKSKSRIKVNYKVLDQSYIDIELKDIINDLLYSIEKQNKDYKKIMQKKIDNPYEGYQVLYEDNDVQSLVTIYKKDNVLLFITFNADSEYFDILIDNVETILNSVEIYSGER